MLDLNLINGAGVSPNSVQAESERNQVGQETFLKLMVTQMQNQDPFKPMESGEFLTQIAQFTTASGISELQQSFDSFRSDMSLDQALRAAELVGHEVLVESERLPFNGADPSNLIVRAPQELGNLTVSIYTPAGQLVREIPMGQQPAGDIEVSWDGNDQNGEPVAAGTYLISATSQISSEEAVALATVVGAEITSVQMGQGGGSPSVHLAGLGEMSLNAVQQIR